MEFRNLTPFDVMCFSALDKQDIEHPVVVMKIGYRLKPIAEKPGHFCAEVMDDEPIPLCLSDTYFGEEGLSSVKEESDLAPFKPRCDVIINGHAYSPGATPAHNWIAGVRLSEPSVPLQIEVEPPKPSRPGEPLTQQQLYAWRDAKTEAHRCRANAPTRNILLDKRLRFTGPRIFKQGFWGGWHLTEAALTEHVPLQWEYALGGSSVFCNPHYPDHATERYLLNQVFYSNPLGRGWVENRHFEMANSLELSLKELPAPQIELIDKPIDKLLKTSVSVRANRLARLNRAPPMRQ